MFNAAEWHFQSLISPAWNVKSMSAHRFTDLSVRRFGYIY
jgi:hypothetical protein